MAAVPRGATRRRPEVSSLTGVGSGNTQAQRPAHGFAAEHAKQEAVT